MKTQRAGGLLRFPTIPSSRCRSSRPEPAGALLARLGMAAEGRAQAIR
jgi:hypothetical protein